MDLDDFVSRYPRLYHMAEDGCWPLVRRLGLLSTQALVEAFDVAGVERHSILEKRRPSSVTIRSAKLGVAVVRDQMPLNEDVLARVLQDGLAPADWYRLLNRHVFFWPTEERLNRLLSARAYRDRVHTVLTVNTRALARLHAARIRLSPINSGSTIFAARPRGLRTLLSVADYPFDEMRRRRGAAGAVAEVAVEGGVAPVMAVLDMVDRRRNGEVTEVLWSSSDDATS